jgi:Phage P2 GpE
MADVAAVWHWPPAVMDAMSVEELMDWHSRALERFEAMNKAPS